MYSQLNILHIAVWAIFFGIVFSVAYITLQKHSLSRFVLGLIDAKAFNKNSSKALSELGINNKFIRSVIYYAVKSQHGLIRIIGFNSLGKEKLPGEFSKITPSDKCTFYIDENSCEETREKYAVKKTKKVHLIICVLVLFILACLATTVISWLSSYAGDVFGGTSSNITKQENNDTLSDEFSKMEPDTDSDANFNTESDNYEDIKLPETDVSAETDTTTDNMTSVNEKTDENTDNSTKEYVSGPTIPKGPMN